MTAEERAGLAESLARPRRARSVAHMLRWLAIWLAVLPAGICVFGGLGWLIGFSDDVPTWRGVLAIVVAATPIFACLMISLMGAGAVIGHYRDCGRYEKDFERTYAPQMREALANGRATVCRISAVGVIVVEESKYDFGSIVIYDLGDGTSFLMWEQDLYNPEDGYFTNQLPQKFEIARTAAHRLWLGLANLEGKLEPELKIYDEDLPEEFFYRRDSPKSESVVPGRPREVLAAFGYEEDDEKA
jgi:hypothetical protein